MKKVLIFTILLIPAISFGQISKKEKKQVAKYASEMCACVNDVINTLDPNAVEFVNIMSTDGPEKAEEFIGNFVASATEEETQALMAAFERMSSPMFTKKIENCSNPEVISSELKKSIDEFNGPGYDYFQEYMKSDEDCHLMNYLISLALNPEGLEE